MIMQEENFISMCDPSIDGERIEKCWLHFKRFFKRERNIQSPHTSIEIHLLAIFRKKVHERIRKLDHKYKIININKMNNFIILRMRVLLLF